ncbi:MAG: hypothetical protein WKG52_00975 [Variovorax sp.]
MKERPILFSAPMVRALLDGSKTQTRRVCKQATGPSLSVGIDDDEPGVAALSWLSGNGPGHDVHETVKKVRCPYGVPGDRLWVRETHAKIIGQSGGWIETDHFATYTHGDRLGDTLGLKKKWTPSIHMPRAASRIDLEVTGVRVERLQDISEADARAEGARECDYASGREVLLAGASQRGSFVLHYRDIWERINGLGSWAANPWVWVVEFKRVRP